MLSTCFPTPMTTGSRGNRPDFLQGPRIWREVVVSRHALWCQPQKYDYYKQVATLHLLSTTDTHRRVCPCNDASFHPKLHCPIRIFRQPLIPHSQCFPSNPRISKCLKSLRGSGSGLQESISYGSGLSTYNVSGLMTVILPPGGE